METVTKKIVVWCGQAANQKALVNKITKQYSVAGLVIDTKPGTKNKRKIFHIPGLIFDRLRFKKIYNAWEKMMNYYYQKFPAWPDVPVLKLNGINNPDAILFTENLKPDLIIVSGTALIKEPLLSAKAGIGIINLHTGLSPYVKGGPNCTNWCIANNDWHLVGNTIFWLNAGIDSGNIITTETIDIRNTDSLLEAHITVMEHAHDLYLRAIDYLLSCQPPFQSISQNSIDKGKLYLTRMWTGEKRKQLLINWKTRKAFQEKVKPVTVSLPSK
jgi:methionyl-tRNA formyltransferase